MIFQRISISCFSLVFTALTATLIASEGGIEGTPPEIPTGLMKISRAPNSVVEEAAIRSLIGNLEGDRKEWAADADELVALDWKAVPLLLATRKDCGYPVSRRIDLVLDRMPLSAFARDGEYVREKDGMVMVWIPPGEIPMPNCFVVSAMSTRRVRVDGFFVDRFLITNRMMVRYLNENSVSHEQGEVFERDSCEAGIFFHNDKWRFWAGMANHPAHNVSYDFYWEYAEWAGATLPTVAQWERAAGAEDGRLFPWGNFLPADPTDRVIICESELSMPVYWFPSCDSPFGVSRMCGNVEQYIADADGAGDDLFIVFDDEGWNPVGLNKDGGWNRRLLKGSSDTARCFTIQERLRLCGCCPSEPRGFRCAIDPGRVFLKAIEKHYQVDLDKNNRQAVHPRDEIARGLIFSDGPSESRYWAREAMRSKDRSLASILENQPLFPESRAAIIALKGPCEQTIDLLIDADFESFMSVFIILPDDSRKAVAEWLFSPERVKDPRFASFRALTAAANKDTRGLEDLAREYPRFFWKAGFDQMKSGFRKMIKNLPSGESAALAYLFRKSAGLDRADEHGSASGETGDDRDDDTASRNRLSIEGFSIFGDREFLAGPLNLLRKADSIMNDAWVEALASAAPDQFISTAMKRILDRERERPYDLHDDILDSHILDELASGMRDVPGCIELLRSGSPGQANFARSLLVRRDDPEADDLLYSCLTDPLPDKDNPRFTEDSVSPLLESLILRMQRTGRYPADRIEAIAAATIERMGGPERHATCELRDITAVHLHPLLIQDLLFRAGSDRWLSLLQCVESDRFHLLRYVPERMYWNVWFNAGERRKDLLKRAGIACGRRSDSALLMCLDQQEGWEDRVAEVLEDPALWSGSSEGFSIDSIFYTILEPERLLNVAGLTVPKRSRLGKAIGLRLNEARRIDEKHYLEYGLDELLVESDRAGAWFKALRMDDQKLVYERDPRSTEEIIRTLKETPDDLLVTELVLRGGKDAEDAVESLTTFAVEGMEPARSGLNDHALESLLHISPQRAVRIARHWLEKSLADEDPVPPYESAMRVVLAADPAWGAEYARKALAKRLEYLPPKETMDLLEKSLLESDVRLLLDRECELCTWVGREHFVGYLKRFPEESDSVLAQIADGCRTADIEDSITRCVAIADLAQRIGGKKCLEALRRMKSFIEENTAKEDLIWTPDAEIANLEAILR